MHSTSPSPASLRWGFAALGALALGAAASVPAYAHDTLIDSTPEADEVLSESPHEVVLEFSGAGLTTGESITNDIVILDSDDEDWASEEPAEVEGSVMRTDIPDPLPNGEYEVRYRVVYSDGHDEELGFSFEVDAPLAEDEDAALADPGEADTTEEPAETSDSGTAAAEPAPTEDEEDDAALGASDTEGTSDQWGGLVFWVALAAAMAGIAAVAWFAVRRRSRGRS